jgi:hypothetical protein
VAAYSSNSGTQKLHFRVARPRRHCVRKRDPQFCPQVLTRPFATLGYLNPLPLSTPTFSSTFHTTTFLRPFLETADPRPQLLRSFPRSLLSRSRTRSSRSLIITAFPIILVVCDSGIRASGNSRSCDPAASKSFPCKFDFLSSLFATAGYEPLRLRALAIPLLRNPSPASLTFFLALLYPKPRRAYDASDAFPTPPRIFRRDRLASPHNTAYDA